MTKQKQGGGKAGFQSLNDTAFVYKGYSNRNRPVKARVNQPPLFSELETEVPSNSILRMT